MLLTQTLGRKVVGVDDASTLGTVSGFVVRPDEPQLAALRLRRPGGRGTLLPWTRVRAVGADAVMAVASPDSTDEEESAGPALSRHAVKHGEVLGKRVLTDLGDEVGEVTDAGFDPESGALLSVLVGDQALDAGRMTGLGSYALVLRASGAPGATGFGAGEG
jgi:sporulation protein YlmC with PRC-barrel domain